MPASGVKESAVVEKFDPHQFTKRDEGLHPPTDDPYWQESVFLIWYDSEAQLGGIHRVGHEPNQGEGRFALSSWIFDQGTGRRYAVHERCPLEPADRATSNSLGAGDRLRFSFDDHPIWEIEDEGISARLDCSDFFPIIDPATHDDKKFTETVAGHHFETACRVTGTIRFEGREAQISALGFRDHSWGPRYWNDMLLNSRWFAGTFGPDLAFSACALHFPDGKVMKWGFLRRPEGLIRTSDVDLVVYMENDGFSHRGGFVVMNFPGEPQIKIECQGMAGVTFEHGDCYLTELLCTTHWKDRTGYCDIEIVSNARNGKGPVTLSMTAPLCDGGIGDLNPVGPIARFVAD
jgi:hypothetical protein